MVLWVVGFADYPGCGGDDGGGCAVEAVAWHGGQGLAWWAVRQTCRVHVIYAVAVVASCWTMKIMTYVKTELLCVDGVSGRVGTRNK